ncbi:hypothetical protein M427DRAFT_39202 [Gonapodya prolifera JEL478]|uniref:Uncharacterized protein n=1 Tax=Gonapodya prolifera (strain JEL478) TaxID=1344416 RepID=A0A138ZXR5_GONPJ|nr:hypothetical protein M427DRAFT_39202 [Gonapodya prolifera JEL478]|eukprot:KXS09276.1 hypothetical protein M427DRAFT_39202 [Gonapodya prolifera JEL478]
MRKNIRDAVKADPEVFKVQLKPIVAVCGPLRSATSLMQNALATRPVTMTMRSSLIASAVASGAPLYPVDENDAEKLTKKLFTDRLDSLKWVLGEDNLERADAAHPMLIDPEEAQEDGPILLPTGGIFSFSTEYTGFRYIDGTLDKTATNNKSFTITERLREKPLLHSPHLSPPRRLLRARLSPTRADARRGSLRQPPAHRNLPSAVRLHGVWMAVFTKPESPLDDLRPIGNSWIGVGELLPDAATDPALQERSAKTDAGRRRGRVWAAVTDEWGKALKAYLLLNADVRKRQKEMGLLVVGFVKGLWADGR